MMISSGYSAASVLDTTKSQTISNFMTLCNAHRTVASYESIGKTLLGNNIWAFKFGNPNGGRVLWTAQLHGNEGMGTEIMWIWAQWLVSNDTKAQQYMKTNYIMMIPVQNYDSYGRQNARRSYVLPNGTTINVPYGVNLNRNFPSGWGTYGSTNPADSGQNYMGLYAGSEPETQALTSATRAFKPRIHVDFHDWGAPLTAGYGDKSLITAISQTQQNYFNTVRPTYSGVALTPYPLQYSGLAGGTWVRESSSMGIGCTSIVVELDPATDSQFRTSRYTACPVWAVQQYYYPKSKGLLLGTLDSTANPLQFGSIMMDSYLNAKPNNLITDYYVTFPNQTTKIYRNMVGGVIYRCPPGSDKIACQTNSQTVTQSVAVVAGQNSNAKFQFGLQPASFIYQDYFEGAFPNSAWTLSQTGNDKVTQTTAHYETGSHSLQAIIDGTESTAEYAFITHRIGSGTALDLVRSSNVYIKAYVRFSTLPTSGGGWCPINLRAKTESPGALAWFDLHKDSTGAYWDFQYRDSTTHTTQTVRISGATVNANQWYSIEIHIKTDCSAGAVGVWIDGKLVLEKTGLNNSEWGSLQYIRLGEICSNPGSGAHSTYIDDLAVSNSYVP